MYEKGPTERLHKALPVLMIHMVNLLVLTRSIQEYSRMKKYMAPRHIALPKTNP